MKSVLLITLFLVQTAFADAIHEITEDNRAEAAADEAIALHDMAKPLPVFSVSPIDQAETHSNKVLQRTPKKRKHRRVQIDSE